MAEKKPDWLLFNRYLLLILIAFTVVMTMLVSMYSGLLLPDVTETKMSNANNEHYRELLCVNGIATDMTCQQEEASYQGKHTPIKRRLKVIFRIFQSDTLVYW